MFSVRLTHSPWLPLAFGCGFGKSWTNAVGVVSLRSASQLAPSATKTPVCRRVVKKQLKSKYHSSAV